MKKMMIKVFAVALAICCTVATSASTGVAGAYAYSNSSSHVKDVRSSTYATVTLARKSISKYPSSKIYFPYFFYTGPVASDTPAASEAPSTSESDASTPVESATPSPSATPTPEESATPSPSATPTPEESATPSPSTTPTPDESATPSPSATPTPEESVSPSPAPSTEPSPSPTPTPTAEVSILDEDGWYTIDNETFGISDSGSDARANTDGINAALQWASESGYNKVKLASGFYLVECRQLNRYGLPDDGILIPSDMTLDLGDAVLQLAPNSATCYNIIAFSAVSNAAVLNGTLIGDRDEHSYTSGSSHEFGFGIGVNASSDILISGVKIQDTTGDGIILRGNGKSLSQGMIASSSVNVSYCDISNCRRNGISVVNAIDCVLSNNVIHDINGTAPQYGIDVEIEQDCSADNLQIFENTIYGCVTGAICANNGSNYDIYSNTCIGNNILAVKSSDVSITGNTMQGNTCIRVYTYATNVTVKDNVLAKDCWVCLDAEKIVYFGE
jgi:hypothetical protein